MKTKEASGKRIIYLSRTDHTEKYYKDTGKKILYKSLHAPLTKSMYSQN